MGQQMQIFVPCAVTGPPRPRRPGTMYRPPSFIFSLLPAEWLGGVGEKKGGQAPTDRNPLYGGLYQVLTKRSKISLKKVTLREN